MIPRYQRVLYWLLMAGILLMGLLMLRGCIVNHQKAVDQRDQSPIPAPTDTPEETVTLANASDAEGTITLDQATLSLPQEPSSRAHVLLDRAMSNAASPTSAHPVPAGPAIADVFFLTLPIVAPPSSGAFGQTGSDLPQNSGQLDSPIAISPYGNYHAPGATLAVVNLTKAFADAHPSGILPEDLTLRALIATLHANFPQVEVVRFLVDGQIRATLAGHAILDRPYPVLDPSTSIHPLAADGTLE